MKKIIQITLVAIFLISTMSFGNTIKPKPGWAIAVVDAGGALAGGGTVLSATGGIAATNPWGWAATGVGAVIGGAAASVGFAYSKVVNNGATNNNPKNDLNAVGIKHNELVEGYINNIGENEVTMEGYLVYIKNNYPEVYSDVEKVIDLKYLEQQKKETNELVEDVDFINWTLNKLPGDVNKDDFKTFLIEYKNITSKEEAVEYITIYENKMLESNLSKHTVELLKYYFATLRNSTILW